MEDWGGLRGLGFRVQAERCELRVRGLEVGVYVVTGIASGSQCFGAHLFHTWEDAVCLKTLNLFRPGPPTLSLGLRNNSLSLCSASLP